MLEWNEPMFFNQQNFELYILLIKKEPLFLSHLSVFFLCRIVIFLRKENRELYWYAPISIWTRFAY